MFVNDRNHVSIMFNHWNSIERSDSLQNATKAKNYFKIDSFIINFLTWDDLACLFLGFDAEPLLSDKKNPDILFLRLRLDWVRVKSIDSLIGQFS